MQSVVYIKITKTFRPFSLTHGIVPGRAEKEEGQDGEERRVNAHDRGDVGQQSVALRMEIV